MGFLETLRSLTAVATAKQASLQAHGELQARLEAIRGERNALGMKPPARSDVERMLTTWVADKAQEFRQQMVERVSPFAKDGRALRDARRISEVITLAATDAAAGVGFDRALCAAIPTELTKAMLASLDHIEWMKDATTLEERDTRLAQLNVDERTAMAELTELEAALLAAGIFF